MVMPSRGEPGGAERSHRYELFEGGRSIGWLEWRHQPRERLGWYLRPHGGPPVRLRVDLAIDDLADARRDDEHGGGNRAGLGGPLWTPPARAAGRPPPPPPGAPPPPPPPPPPGTAAP